MDVNHGDGGKSPQEFSIGDANANCPPDFVMFQNFKHHIAALGYNAVKSLLTPWLCQSIHYSPKVHLQRPPNHHFRRKIQQFSGDDTDKNTQNAQNTVSSEKCNVFFWEWGLVRHHTSPHQAFWIRPCIPRIPAKSAPLLKTRVCLQQCLWPAFGNWH